MTEFKIKQERESREPLFYRHLEDSAAEHKRISTEEFGELKSELKHEKDQEVVREVEDLPNQSQLVIPQLPIMQSELGFESKRAELKIALPSKEDLTDRQKVLLCILYNFLQGKRLEEILTVISEVLRVSVKDLLRELLTLESSGLLLIRNGIVVLTNKGELVAGTVTIDENLANKIRASLIRVPKIPQINLLPVHTKLIDREYYLTRIQVTEKELLIPAPPRVLTSNVTLREVSRAVCTIPVYRARASIVPYVPFIVTSRVNTKVINKEIFTVLIVGGNKIELSDVSITKRGIDEPKSKHLPSSLLTMLFKPIKKYDVRGLLSVKPDRPVIIIAIKMPNEDYIGTLLSILREIYRIKAAGLPISRYVGTKTEKSIIEDEPMRHGMIKVVDDSKESFLNFFGISKIEDFDKVDINKLKDRLIELSTQGLCFVVFYISKDRAEMLLRYLAAIKDKISPVKIIVLHPRKLSTEFKKELARISWGFVEPRGALINDSLDQHFKCREELFYNKLERLTSEWKIAKIVKESKESEEGIEGYESALHYQLKMFIVRYLIEKQGIPEEDIETEFKLDNKMGIADIYVKSRRLAIEIETFYGTGLTTGEKLWRTIKKYTKSNVANEVWIVIPPLQTILYLKDLVDQAEELERRGYNYIKFFTVDLSRKELVPLEKVKELITKLLLRNYKGRLQNYSSD